MARIWRINSIPIGTNQSFTNCSCHGDLLESISNANGTVKYTFYRDGQITVYNAYSEFSNYCYLFFRNGDPTAAELTWLNENATPCSNRFLFSRDGQIDIDGSDIEEVYRGQELNALRFSYFDSTGTHTGYGITATGNEGEGTELTLYTDDGFAEESLKYENGAWNSIDNRYIEVDLSYLTAVTSFGDNYYDICFAILTDSNQESSASEEGSYRVGIFIPETTYVYNLKDDLEFYDETDFNYTGNTFLSFNGSNNVISYERITESNNSSTLSYGVLPTGVLVDAYYDGWANAKYKKIEFIDKNPLTDTEASAEFKAFLTRNKRACAVCVTSTGKVLKTSTGKIIVCE